MYLLYCITICCSGSPSASYTCKHVFPWHDFCIHVPCVLSIHDNHTQYKEGRVCIYYVCHYYWVISNLFSYFTTYLLCIPVVSDAYHVTLLFVLPVLIVCSAYLHVITRCSIASYVITWHQCDFATLVTSVFSCFPYIFLSFCSHLNVFAYFADCFVLLSILLSIYCLYYILSEVGEITWLILSCWTIEFWFQWRHFRC